VELRVTLPDLGEDSVQGVTVSGWLAQKGAEIAEGDDLIELTTDKAAFTLPAPQSGTVTEWLVNEGDEINVGDPVCVMDVPNA
jgi:2-oxoisovalerate dehydrogenase E2 component (dihydrolipoyl transacylase)